ncbi:hypothetical protein AVEN_102051-1 [Araneus ventricosus]|uniref:Uncharacterized protein n=1 Tax=Araneus ventricosus TaxID=182803 RepID=A0A4Y2U429_ARAVE|nr:hypothetical protein AVEN_102051-1 [Araneus ventricosus]
MKQRVSVSENLDSTKESCWALSLPVEQRGSPALENLISSKEFSLLGARALVNRVALFGVLISHQRICAGGWPGPLRGRFQFLRPCPTKRILGVRAGLWEQRALARDRDIIYQRTSLVWVRAASWSGGLQLF